MSKVTTKQGRGSFGWQIQFLANIVEKSMRARLKAHNLSIPEFSTIMSLLENDGSTQAVIGKNNGFPQYSTSRVVDKLEEKGIVVRKPHPTSRRAHLVFLTDNGKNIALELSGAINDNNDLVLESLDKQERTILHKLLIKVIENNLTD